jgi:cytochrome c553
MRIRWPAALLASALTATASIAQSPPKADPTRAQKIVTEVCSACHGSDGNSVQPANPTLAGQHADYIFKQLTDFTQHGGKPAQRSNPVMAGMAAPLSEENKRDLAAYFEIQKRKPRAARDPKLVKAGQAIYRGGIAARGIAACTACHGPEGAGVPALFPRLAGQFPEYTAAQLKAFRSGERSNDPNRMMRTEAERLSDREIAALAEYLAGLR